MAQVRITLEEPNIGAEQGVDVKLRFGTEDIVPMNFGPMDDANSVNFRNPQVAMPAIPREWILSWSDMTRREALVPIEVAIHWFGDWRSEDDGPQVRAGRVPKMNVERDRVARIWGDYHFSAKHGMYSTVKIAVPRVPHVSIRNVNENGATVGEWCFKPWDFFAWDQYLDPNAKAEYEADLLERKAKHGGVSALDIIGALTPAQVAQLAEAIKAVNPKQKATHG